MINYRILRSKTADLNDWDFIIHMLFFKELITDFLGDIVSTLRRTENDIPKHFLLTTANLHWTQCLEASVRRAIRLGLYTTNPTPSPLVADMDHNLFANILFNPHHVLHKFLPNKTDHSYNLRSRRLTIKTHCNNFLNRLLFNDIY